MLDTLLLGLAKFILWLRYRVRIKGMQEVAAKGRRQILLLPNHPAYVDPVILYVYLHKTFEPVGFGDETQISRPGVGFFARRWGVHSLPNIAERGSAARQEVREKLAAGARDLQQGRNLMLWPGGTVTRSRHENLGGNSAVETMLRKCPEARVVLIRTRGLWGSSLSWASGEKPKIASVMLRAAVRILANFVFFMPRREVTIELQEPEDFPRNAERSRINRYIEGCYNQEAPPNLFVPYTFWEKLAGDRARVLPEPIWERQRPDTSQVPLSTREAVADYLQKLTGVSEFEDDSDLAFHLGLDSLSRTDIALWLEREFGFPQFDTDVLRTIGDVMLAACGQFFRREEAPLRAPAKPWFRAGAKGQIALPPGDSINQVFLAQAKSNPGSVVMADQVSGEKTYRQVIMSCLALHPSLQALESERVAIMMPASVGAAVVYLATLFAGKTPVMLNWTLGAGPAEQCLNSVRAGKIITSKKVYDKVRTQGFDFTSMQERFLFLEDMARDINLGRKLWAGLRSLLNWGALRRTPPPPDAAILFTSGSETIPKAVPLTHRNLLANIGDVVGLVDIQKQEKLIGFLPPFHSFGLTCTVLIPVLCGARVVFHANPMEPQTISRILTAYQVNILMGTPTFLKGILKVAGEGRLHTLRLVVTGAEKCPEDVYRMLSSSCPAATVLEGYGITECSPVVALNDLRRPVQGSIGRVLPSFEYKLLDPESREPVASPGRGVLVVRGPSVFRGYLNDPGKKPFVEADGKKWYDTGDLVNEDENQILFFEARLKRFIKLGGEMISLPAIEQTLNRAFAGDADQPILAVEADESGGDPEIVLFTTRPDISREKANQAIRKAEMSGLQNIRRVRNIKEIPVLGTGKIDYRTLKNKIESVGNSA